MRTTSLVAALAASTCIVAIATPAQAQQATFNIPAGNLKSALDAYGRQSGRPIVYKADEVRDVRSPGYRGAGSPEQALEALLANTGFSARAGASGSVAIVRSGNGQAASGGADTEGAATGETNPEILVTGSRIRGAKPTAPVIVISQDDMRNSGQGTLGEAMRSLPQNFSGGQNPGVADGAPGTNRNISGASTINLRGIGPDATLTLLNGHRLAYDYGYQGIDVGAIPVAAVDRVEIVADGASAIYGSDAVAGVANIILKSNFTGLSTTARFGAATGGGDEQQDYSAVAGHTWDGGGVMVVYDYLKTTPIVSRQRPFTLTSQGDQTLLPGQRQHSAIVTAHQSIVPGLTFSVDGTYNNRTSEVFGARTTTLPPHQEGQELYSRAVEYSVSPKLDLAVSSDWKVSLSGTYARSITRSDSRYQAAGATLIDNPSRYDNATRVVELSGDGHLLQINGNDAALALGTGYRSNSLHQEITTVFAPSAPTVTRFNGTSSSYYGFGELSLPIISPSNQAGIYRLSLTGAVRYENYGDAGDVATPKIGGVFAPFEGLEFKASWGKSFKAPTLTQLYNTPLVYYARASTYGFPGAGNILILLAGNPELKNERATTFSTSVVATPSFARGLRLEVSYFKIRYTDRVVSAPIADLTAAYGNPSYVSLLTLNPSAAQISTAVARSPQPVVSQVGTPFDPSTVSAIVDDRNVNIAQQDLHGVDILLNYDIESATIGRLSFSGLASYLQSNQTLLPGQVPIQLAGTAFDPPHWRGRGSITWSKNGLTLNAAANYSGTLIDDRPPTRIDLGTKTTFDLTARYTSPADDGFFSGFDISLSALNILDAKPRAVRFSTPQGRPYDSTNDSPIGRFVSLTITKRW